MNHRYKILVIIYCTLFFFGRANAQCTAYDGEGILTNNPVWLSCFGTNYTLNFQSTSTFSDYTIDWGDGSPIESGISFTPPQILSHIYGATIDSFTVTFTETATGCTIIGTVIMEEPTTASIQIPFGGITQTCAPAPLEFINSSTNSSPTTVFTWDFGDGSPLLVLDHTNQGDTVTHNYVQGTVDCETQVQLIAENQCNIAQGGPSTATFNPIRIWDIDNATITASDVLLCFPETEVTFSNTTTRNCLAQGNTFQRQEFWNFGDHWGLGYDSIVNWTPWPPTFPHIIDYPGIGSYDVMLVDSNFCGRDTAYLTVQIVPPPTANFAILDDTVCVNELAQFTNTSTGGANVNSWNFGDGSGWQNISGNPSHSYVSPGDFTISLAVSIAGANTCADTISLPVHVLAIPQANFVLDDNIGCDALTVNYTDASINAIDWVWDFDNGNTFIGQTPPAQDYTSTGNFNPTLTVTATNGCSDSETQTVSIFQSPIVDFTPQSVCANTLATFSDQSTSSAGDPIVSWNWDFDNGQNSTNQNPTTTYLSDGTYNITLEVNTANCNNTDIIPITVEPLPVANFTQDVLSGCTDLLVNFTNTSSGAVTYTWDFGDGNSSGTIDPSHTFVNNNAIDIDFTTSLIASTAFGCTDTAYSTTTVFFGVASQFTHNGFPGCAPLDVIFTNQSSTGQTYEWNFGDGQTDVNFNTTHQYINTSLFIDTYITELVVTSANGCTDTSSQTITVYPLPDFSFATLPDSGCSPLLVDFPSVVGAVSYEWDYGDGTSGIGPSPQHVYSNSTTNDVVYDIQLIATSPFGCKDTNYGQVKVFPNPTAQFTIPTTQGCAPFEATFQNNSIGANSYQWFYGTGDSSSVDSASHNYTYYNLGPNVDTYDMYLVATTDKGCTDTMIQTITIFPKVTADFNVDTSGCHPFHGFFNNQSSNATIWQWDFDNGFTDVVTNPNEYFFNLSNDDSIFNVQLVASSVYGCSDTAYQDILVFAIPNAQFTATPVNQTFPNTTVTLTNSSTLGSWEYDWNFGDGNIATGYNPADHAYTSWGDYTIELIVSSDFCSDTATQDISIIAPLPVPLVYGSGFGCRPVTIQFTDSSQYVDTYFWDFGDGGFSTLPNPYYTYYQPGTYDINLTVTGPGGVQTITISDSVEVYEYANAFFQHGPTSVYVPSEPVLFYNLSSYSTDYFWDFGDGTTSNLENPEHFYTDAGTYDITLIANNQNNCPDTIIVTNAVFAETGGTIEFPNAFTPNTSGPNGGYYDPNAVNNDVFFPVFKGVEEYKLMVFNRWGELIFESTDQNIGWDGYYRDQLCQQDVYIWKAKVKFTNGKEKTFVGELHLIR